MSNENHVYEVKIDNSVRAYVEAESPAKARTIAMAGLKVRRLSGGEIRGLYEKAVAHYGDVSLFLFSDHGMTDIKEVCDVMGRIDKTAFSQAFAAWVQEALPSLVGHQIALDGKTLRGSARGAQSNVHLMTAFATQARLVTERTAKPHPNKSVMLQSGR